MLSCLKKQSAVYTTTTTTDAVVTAVATVTNYMFDVSTFRRVCTLYSVQCTMHEEKSSVDTNQ